MEVAALGHGCAALVAQLWASLRAAEGLSAPDCDALRRRLEPAMEGAFLPLLAQLSALTPPAPAAPDVTMQDTLDGRGGLGSGGPAALAPSLGGEGSAESLDGGEGLHPSEATRLAICLRILHGWRCDSVAEQLQALSDRHGAARGVDLAARYYSRQGMAQGGGWGQSTASGAAPPPALSHQLILQVRTRASVLCSAFVHACSALLALRFVSPSAADKGPASGTPHLRFAGCSTHFASLLTVVELSLHLLRTHLVALAAAAELGGAAVTAAAAASAAPAPGPGAPRLALVVQHLRALRQVSAAAGDAIMLVPLPLDGARGAAEATEIRPRTVDLSFAALAAERAEALLMELQSL